MFASTNTYICLYLRSFYCLPAGPGMGKTSSMAMLAFDWQLGQLNLQGNIAIKSSKVHRSKIATLLATSPNMAS